MCMETCKQELSCIIALHVVTFVIGMVMDVKCKNCRKDLLNNESVQLFTAHSEIKKNPKDSGCGVNNDESVSYISTENMPAWIERVINQESWTKGRLHCPYCNNRVGSFNFVRQSKCNCNEFITPPIKIINSKVDILLKVK